jgi:site-specific recombinase XerC/predicted DNA-binding transcriptional regulator AlpA
MGSTTTHLGNPPADTQKRPGLPQLLTVNELCDALKVSASWIYQRTMKSSSDPLPVVRLGTRSMRFDLDKVFHYIRRHERHRAGARLELSDGSAPNQEKGHFKLTRKRIQTGSIRLREDGNPPYWEGFYREDVVTEAGKKVRRRRAVNLGSVKELSEKAARQKLVAILEPINQGKCRPKTMMTFRGFLGKYRTLKLANLKGTTVHGYETNIHTHYLPEFGDMQLSEISKEAVQSFINLKAKEGKKLQTLKNLKWGLSSIFVAAAKYGYMDSNPAASADLPPKEVKERRQLPSNDQLSQLINALEEPISTLVYLMAVSSIRPEELAFKWLDLDAANLDLWVVRAINQGEIHTPKYHRSNRPIRLTEADVQRLLALKTRMKAQDDDWMFPNRIRKGKKLKPGPIWHETLLGRRVQPVARRLGLPHITWRLLRHWGVTSMIRAKMELPAVQQRIGHSRPGILLEYYAEVLPSSADDAAVAMSGTLAGVSRPGGMGNPVEV